MPKVSINVPKKLLALWKKEITNQAECCRSAKISRSALSNALETGKCMEITMNRINGYLVKKRRTLSAIKEELLNVD